MFAFDGDDGLSAASDLLEEKVGEVFDSTSLLERTGLEDLLVGEIAETGRGGNCSADGGFTGG